MGFHTGLKIFYCEDGIIISPNLTKAKKFGYNPQLRKLTNEFRFSNEVIDAVMMIDPLMLSRTVMYLDSKLYCIATEEEDVSQPIPETYIVSQNRIKALEVFEQFKEKKEDNVYHTSIDKIAEEIILPGETASELRKVYLKSVEDKFKGRVKSL